MNESRLLATSTTLQPDHSAVDSSRRWLASGFCALLAGIGMNAGIALHAPTATALSCSSSVSRNASVDWPTPTTRYVSSNTVPTNSCGVVAEEEFWVDDVRQSYSNFGGGSVNLQRRVITSAARASSSAGGIRTFNRLEVGPIVGGTNFVEEGSVSSRTTSVVEYDGIRVQNAGPGQVLPATLGFDSLSIGSPDTIISYLPGVAAERFPNLSSRASLSVQFRNSGGSLVYSDRLELQVNGHFEPVPLTGQVDYEVDGWSVRNRPAVQPVLESSDTSINIAAEDLLDDILLSTDETYSMTVEWTTEISVVNETQIVFECLDPPFCSDLIPVFEDPGGPVFGDAVLNAGSTVDFGSLQLLGGPVGAFIASDDGSIDGGLFTGALPDPISTAWVPEPSTALLLGLGMAGLAARRRKPGLSRVGEAVRPGSAGRTVRLIEVRRVTPPASRIRLANGWRRERASHP